MANEYQEFSAKGSTVRARVSEGKETVNTVSGPVDVAKGDIVVATNNPNIVDVLTEQQWNSTDYPASAQSDSGSTKTTKSTTK